MLKRIEFVFTALIVSPLVVSCVQDVILDARDEPQVVVACLLTDDSEQTLRLSFTKGASISEAQPLTEARAALYAGEERIGEFTHRSGEEWTLAYAALPGRTYRLEVEVPGYERIWAEQTMPSPPQIQCIGYTHFADCIEPWSGWDYPWGKWEDIDGLIYSPRLWPRDEAFPDYETYYVLWSAERPVWIYAMSYNPATGKHEMAREICTDAVVDSCNVLDKVYDPPQQDVRNPWKFSADYGEPGKEQGFYAAHRTELYPTLGGMSMHDRFLRVLPTEDIQVFALSGNFEGEFCRRQAGNEYYGNYPLGYAIDIDGRTLAPYDWGLVQDLAEDEGYILCMSYSKDYEHYLFESRQYQEIRASADLSTIYFRDNIYSNIHGGGIGIFGAATSRKYPWGRAYTYVDSGIPRKDLVKLYRNSYSPYFPPTSPL